MERYHIFKLGLAIIFYAVFCIRPMMVNGLDTDDVASTKNTSNPSENYLVYYQGVEGKPGIDFPVYSHIPRTGFDCKGLETGYYADLDTDCQVFHICEDGKKISFLCPNGTIFQQSDLICEWWFKVNCTNSPNLYEESAEQWREDIIRRKASRRVNQNNNNNNNHGAVMRMEEASSVSAVKNGQNFQIRVEEPVRKRVVNRKRVDGRHQRKNQESHHHGNDLVSDNDSNIDIVQSQSVYPSPQEIARSRNQNSNNEVVKSHDDSRNNNKQHVEENTGQNLNNNNNERGNTQRQIINYQNFNNNNNNQIVRSQKVAEEHNINGENTPRPVYNHNKSRQNHGRNYHNNNEVKIQQETTPKPNYNQNNFYETTQKPNYSTNFATTPKSNYDDFRISQNHNFETTTKSYERNQNYFSGNDNRNFETTPKSSNRNDFTISENHNFENTPQSNYYSNRNFETTPKSQNQNDFNRNQQISESTPKSNFNSNQNEFNRNTQNSDNRNFETTPKSNYKSNQNGFNRNTQTFENRNFQTTPKSNYNGNQNDFNRNIHISENQNYETTPKSNYNGNQIDFTRNQQKFETTPKPNYSVNDFVRNQQSNFASTPRPFFNNNNNNNNKVEQVKQTTQYNNFQSTTERNIDLGGVRYTIKQFKEHTNYQKQPINTKTYDSTSESTILSTTTFAPTSQFPLHKNEQTVTHSEADESQIPQETASFYKNNHNTIRDNHYKSTLNPYPNHRPTYSDLQQPPYYSPKNSPTISSVTPQYITTQSINNGKPFIGSRVGSTIQNMKITQDTTERNGKSTIILGVVRHSNPETTLPPPSTYFSSTTVTPLLNIAKVSFNTVGNVDVNKPQSTVGLSSTSTTTPPPRIVTANPNDDKEKQLYVRISGNNPTPRTLSTTKPTQKVRTSFSLSSNGKSTSLSSNSKSTTTSAPIRPSGFSTFQPPLETSTKRIDHATVYGTFVKATKTTPLPPVSTPSGFRNGINAEIFTNDVGSTKDSSSKSGFYVTKNFDTQTTPQDSSFSLGTSSSSYFGATKNDKIKPRPFETSQSTTGNNNNNKSNKKSRVLQQYDKNNANFVTPTSLTYKISSASPFMLPKKDSDILVTPSPTLPTPSGKSLDFNSVYENVDNMINVLMEIAKVKDSEDHSSETPRPGLIIPPSAGPQTLHTLAVYFANALDGIAAEKNFQGTPEKLQENKEKLTALLTQMTQNHYEELFKKNQQKKVESIPTTVRSNIDDEDENGLEGQHSKNLVQSSPRIRELARNFSQALSSYLDNPEMFRKDLQNFRPTEPPEIETNTYESGNPEEELLNFSDADSKSSYPPIFPTVPSVAPTWGYILAFNNNSKNHDIDVKNSLSPDLQLADTQSFVPKFNNANAINTKSRTSKQTDLPPNHWTASPDATKLWQKTFSVNPIHFNKHFDTTEAMNEATSTEDETEEPETPFDEESEIKPQHEIKYELRSLPKLSLNSTQVHGILIDFMNTTKVDDTNRFLRILRKLNTTEGEFLTKMKEIENNPLTKRLILLLISECGANVTKSLETLSQKSGTINSQELLQMSSSNAAVTARYYEKPKPIENTALSKIVDENLKEDDHDTRALQLLNSLYTIASRFGK